VKRAARFLLFAKHITSNPVSIAFQGRWPSVATTLARIKVNGGYKAVVGILQRFESAVMIGGVIGGLRREHPDMIVAVIHDALLVKPGDEETARAVISRVRQRWGATPWIKVG